MNGTQTELPMPELTEPTRIESGWGWQRMILFIFGAFLLHVALIFSFGAKKISLPKTTLRHEKVPEIQLASRGDELVELENPALFTLPNPRDFAAAVWLKKQEASQPSFRWTEDPRWLPLAGNNLGAGFNRLMQTNVFSEPPLNFKASPQFLLPQSGPVSTLPEVSTLQLSPNLTARVIYQPPLPSFPVNDVIAPSRVRVLVDTDGKVISTILLPPANSFETTDKSDEANDQALVLARSLQFKPSGQVGFGEAIFYWHTVPMPVVITNAP